jgi:hypothetical protein
MNTKSILRLSLIVALLAAPMVGFAQEEGEAPAVVLGDPGPWIYTFWGVPYTVPGSSAAEGNAESSVELGFYGTDVDGSPDMAAEYDDTASGVTAGATVSAHQDWGSVYFLGAFQSSNTNAGELDFDIKRMVRSHNSYEKFIHRLGHDPMTNLEATSFNGKVVEHTDYDPDQEYDLTYAVFSSRTEFQLPSVKALTLGVQFDEQKREGHRQAFTTSHCDTCHIKSQSHALNEKTSDGTLDAKVAWKGGYVKGAFTSRSLKYGTNSVQTTFDDNLHPELQLPVFDNRMQYDSDVGAVPADMWPNSDKDKTRLDLVFNNVGGFTITANGVWSQTENDYTNLQSDYKGYIVSAAKGWKNGWRLRWRGNVYSIDNDDVFVDVNDRLSIAGPHAGRTYEDVYGLNFDFTRKSALNRDVFESKADLSYRFGRKAGTLRFTWDYDTIDRENYEVLPGEFKTSTNLLGASWRARPATGWQLEANLKYATVDNAFTLINGACSTLVSGSYPNPWNPETPQYTQFHEARIAETTASASSWGRADLRLGYTTGTTTVFGKYIYYDGDNTDGDLTEWSRQNNTALVTVWSAPIETFNWYATYTWMDSDLNVPVCIPVFDG